MSFLTNLFTPSASSQTPAAVPAATPDASGQQGQQVQQGQPPEAQVTTPAGTENPFASLWVVDPETEQQAKPFSLGLDQTQLAEAAKKLTLAPIIPDTIKQRIAAGGQDAIAAMMEMQDLTAQTVFARNATATTALIEQAVQSTEQKMLGIIDDRIKTMGVRNTAMQENPALNDPAVRPIAQAIQQRIIAKFPEASAAEVAAKTQEYFAMVSKALNPQAQNQAQMQQPTYLNQASVNKETDWLKELLS